MVIRFEWKQVERYGTENVKFAKQARKMLCDQLGFEPPRHIAYTGEMTIRNILRKMDKGEHVSDNLNYQLDVQTELIKTKIIKYAPEHQHLLNS